MQQTLENLTKAFIGESQARNRYNMYAKTAKKEGYEQIAAVFEETAEQEREHAKQLFRMMQMLKADANEEMEAVMVEVETPLALGDTVENLKAAIQGEHYEFSSMYPDFAQVAEEEGYVAFADKLRAIAVAEMHHEDRYKKLLAELDAGTVFAKKQPTRWVCRKCGYMHEGENPPEACPSCNHPTAYFQVQCEKY